MVFEASGVPLRYVLFSGVALAIVAVVTVVVKALKRAEPRDRSDRVAPNVLARINVEYHDQ